MTEPKKRATRKKAAAVTPAPESVEVAPVSVVGQRVGYVRVSTVEQSTARQLDGVEGLARVFTDKASGKDTARPALAELLEYVRGGDTVVVHSLDRLGRNLDDLRALVSRLAEKGVVVHFVKEGLRFEPGGASPIADLMLSMMGAFAQFERALMLERQREGIAKAKEAGKYKGRAPALSDDLIAVLLRRVAAGENRAALAREFGIGRATLYRYIEEGAASSAAAPAAPAPEPVATPAPAKKAAAKKKATAASPAPEPLTPALRRALGALSMAGSVAEYDGHERRWVAGFAGAPVALADLEELERLGRVKRTGEGEAAVFEMVRGKS